MPKKCWRACRRSSVLVSVPASTFTLRADTSREAGLDEIIQIAVKNRPGIALFNTGAKVLHHLVGMQHIGPDLVTPANVRL